MFSGGNNDTSPLTGLGGRMGNNMPVDPVVDTAITFAQGASAATGGACRSPNQAQQNHSADSSDGGMDQSSDSGYTTVDQNSSSYSSYYSADVSSPEADAEADQSTPVNTGLSMYRSATSPSCRAVNEGYSWQVGDDTYHMSDVSISNFTDPSFGFISNLWIAGRFEENGIDADELRMFVITDPTTGPATLDNICYTHKFSLGISFSLPWNWRPNWFASAKHTTTEGESVSVDYHIHEEHLGIQNKQELILQVLAEKRVGAWHQQMHDYIGELENLSLAFNNYSTDEDADNYDADVAAYINAVDNALTAEPRSMIETPPIGEIESEGQVQEYIVDVMNDYIGFSMEYSRYTGGEVPEFVMADFFDKTAPLSLTEEQIIGVHTDTEHKAGALDKLGVYSEVENRWSNDKEMVMILKAAWYIRKAYEIAGKQDISSEDADQASVYVHNALAALVSNDLLMLPVDTEELARSLRQSFVEKARAENPEITQEQLDQLENQPLGPIEVEVVKQIVQAAISNPVIAEQQMGEYTSNIADKQRQHMVLWILLKITNFRVKRSLTALDCLGASNIEAGEYYVLNEAGDNCVQCDPGMTTDDGERCLFSAEYCFDQNTVQLRGQDYSTHYYNQETNECIECPDNQVVASPADSEEACQARPQPPRHTGGGGHHQQQQQQQQTQTGSALPIGMNQPF